MRYVAMVVQNLVAALLIGASLHGCASGSDVWGWGVFFGGMMVVWPGDA